MKLCKVLIPAKRWQEATVVSFFFLTKKKNKWERET